MFHQLIFDDIAVLDVDLLCDPKINDKAIDLLVMDNAIKGPIKAICETYTQSRHEEDHFSADFIEGKGEGQIFLLHGPPGTGKTLTAGVWFVS